MNSDHGHWSRPQWVAWARTPNRDAFLGMMFCENGIGAGMQISGGHAEYMVAFADPTMLLPDGLDYEQAAPLFCAGYTVWSGLRWVEPQPNESVAVVGIGGLGHLAVQLREDRGFQDDRDLAFARQRQTHSPTWRRRNCA
jgi:NADPH:quinone reductase-like Zn-dependent oxidoreductase